MDSRRHPVVIMDLPTRSRAVVWKSVEEGLCVEDFDRPTATSPNEVVLRVKVAMFGAALVRAVTKGHPKLQPPRVLGTLVVGEVVEKGSAVASFRVGDRLTVDPHPPCGVCGQCHRGLPALCSSGGSVKPGAHSEYVLLDDSLVRAARIVPPSLSDGEALLTEITACAISAMREAGSLVGKSVLVVGCGVAGLILIQCALRDGAAEVLCTTTRDSRALIAENLGAKIVDANSIDAEDQIALLTDGAGPDVVIEAVGSAPTYELSLRVVRPGGVVVAFGGCPTGTTITIDPNRLHYQRIRFIGAYHYEADLFDEALSALASGEVKVKSLLTHVFSLDEVPKIPTLLSKQDCITAVIVPNAPNCNDENT